MDKRNFWEIIKEVMILVSIGVIALIILNWTTDIFKTPKERIIEKEIPVLSEPEPSKYPDYTAIKGINPDPKIKSVNITVDCPEEGCKNDKPATIEFDGIERRYKVKGIFSRAYLYIEAVVDYGRPLTSWDDFYFKANNLGGHLITDENLLPIPASAFTRYLYDLRSISYYPSIDDKSERKNKKYSFNFFDLLKNDTMLNIVAAISSDRPGRIMKEVSIYYECFEGSGCNIEEIR